jgi:hypothetical protein
MNELKTISYTVPTKSRRNTKKKPPIQEHNIDVKNLLSEISSNSIAAVGNQLPYSNLKNNNSNRPTYREYVANNLKKSANELNVPVEKTHSVGKKKGKITIRIGTKKRTKNKSLSNKQMLRALRKKSLLTNINGDKLPYGMIEIMYNNSTELEPHGVKSET